MTDARAVVRGIAGEPVTSEELAQSWGWFKCTACGLDLRVASHVKGEFGEFVLFGCSPCRRRYVWRLDGEPHVWAEDTSAESVDDGAPRLWGSS